MLLTHQQGKLYIAFRYFTVFESFAHPHQLAHCSSPQITRSCVTHIGTRKKHTHSARSVRVLPPALQRASPV